jgi:Mn2+/Fe2+ NRAMP family transporter
VIDDPNPVLILLVANDRTVIRKYTNGWFDNVFGWLAVLIMIASAATMFYRVLAGA